MQSLGNRWRFLGSATGIAIANRKNRCDFGALSLETPKKSRKCLLGPPAPEPRKVSKKSREQSDKTLSILSGDFSDCSRDFLETFRGSGDRGPRRHFRDFFSISGPEEGPRDLCKRGGAPQTNFYPFLGHFSYFRLIFFPFFGGVFFCSSYFFQFRARGGPFGPEIQEESPKESPGAFPCPEGAGETLSETLRGFRAGRVRETPVRGGQGPNVCNLFVDDGMLFFCSLTYGGNLLEKSIRIPALTWLLVLSYGYDHCFAHLSRPKSHNRHR